MKPFSLIDDGGTQPDQALQTIGIAGSAKTLSKAQKQFNKHIVTIEATMRKIEQWQIFLPIYHQYIASQFTPLEVQLREKRIAMVRLLDQHMSGKALSHAQRKKALDLLSNMLGGLLDQEESAELIQLHDKYSGISFEEYQEQDNEIIRTLAGDIFGIKLDAAAASADELMAQFHRMASEREERKREKRERRKAAKKPTNKAAEQAACIQNATRAVRDIYRKLASALHPDREPDPQRRAELTALMQQANRAYDESDLLALLKLQIQIEQIDSQALTQIAQERLDSYNQMLREQSERLQRELFEIQAPFVAMDIAQHEVTPQAVQHAMNADAQELQDTLRGLDYDLLAFEDVRQLKNWLKDYRIEKPR
jgi:hypothetical protein